MTDNPAIHAITDVHVHVQYMYNQVTRLYLFSFIINFQEFKKRKGNF